MDAPTPDRLTRRRFFAATASTLSGALGVTALASSLGAMPRASSGGGPQGPHFRPRCKRVIYLHMEGGPSQLDLFDYKPRLQEWYDQELPDSVRGGQRLTGMTSGQSRFPIAPSAFRFSRWDNGGDGVWISELMPHLGAVADELCFVHSMHTDAINHEPAITFVQTGTQQPGRPSFGAWTSYGLGSDNRNLPNFVVLITQGFGNMQALASRFWGSGFLPSQHQGCKLRSSGDPVLYLNDPAGVSRADRRAMLDLVADFGRRELARTLDPEIEARIAQQEMAFRMQASVPELTDVSGEPDSTWKLYGEEARQPGTFAGSCLLARRLAERGVRFVQLFMRGWDQHGNRPRRCGCNAGPSTGRSPHCCSTSAGAASWTTRWCSSPASSGARSTARAACRATITAATTTRDASPSGWPAAARAPGPPTAGPATTATTSWPIRSPCTTCTPRCCICSASTTSASSTGTRVATSGSPTSPAP
jgi:hypothetical protein